MKFEGKNNVNTITWNTIVCGVVFIIIILLLICYYFFLILASRWALYLDESFYLPFLFLLPRLFITITVLYLYLDDYTILQEEITE